MREGNGLLLYLLFVGGENKRKIMSLILYTLFVGEENKREIKSVIASPFCTRGKEEENKIVTILLFFWEDKQEKWFLILYPFL